VTALAAITQLLISVISVAVVKKLLFMRNANSDCRREQHIEKPQNHETATLPAIMLPRINTAEMVIG